MPMVEAKHRIHSGRQVHRRRERERLRGDACGVGGARGVAPGQRTGVRRLVAQRPGRVRRPDTAARLAVVEQRKIHARKRGRLDLVARRAESVGVDDHDAVEVLRLRRDRDVGERRDRRIGHGPDLPRVAPIEAGGKTTVDLVGGETAAGRAPGQIETVSPDTRGLGEHDSFRRIADPHIVDMPTIAHDRLVREQAEAHPEIRLTGMGRQIELRGSEIVGLAGVRRDRIRPRGPAVGRHLHQREVVLRLKGVPMVEREHRSHQPGQADRVGHRDRRIGVVVVERAGAVGGTMGWGGGALRGEVPGTRGRPSRGADLERVGEDHRRLRDIGTDQQRTAHAGNTAKQSNGQRTAGERGREGIWDHDSLGTQPSAEANGTWPVLGLRFGYNSTVASTAPSGPHSADCEKTVSGPAVPRQADHPANQRCKNSANATH